MIVLEYNAADFNLVVRDAIYRWTKLITVGVKLWIKTEVLIVLASIKLYKFEL